VKTITRPRRASGSNKPKTKRRRVSAAVTRFAAEFGPKDEVDFSDVPDSAVKKYRSVSERRAALARLAAEFAPKAGEKPGHGGAVAFLLKQRRAK
jgi:hypothetical protein